jgi:methylaspartate ammonia-lyase
VKIVDVVFGVGRTGFFVDDQAAIRAGAAHDGFDYVGTPVTPGFTKIREPGESLSIMLLLDDGAVAFGDCATVQYAGVGGREPVFHARQTADALERHLSPHLRGLSLENFRSLAERCDALIIDGQPLHVAVRYGLSQALLDAVAHARGVTMAEVVVEEYGTSEPLVPVPMFVQSGDDRYTNVEKMIAKEVEVLPHGLINNVATKFGSEGELFLEYVAWVRQRIVELRRSDQYAPTLHFDLYGTAGEAFGGSVTAVADFLVRVEEVAAPFALRVEHPIDAGSRAGQIATMAALRNSLRERGSAVQLVADEWCNTVDDIREFVAAGSADVIHVKTPDLGGVHNTIEALLHVKRAGLLAYCGGTCNETDRSAQVSAHLAMACGAAQVLAKPGMGVDEGLMIVGNEMARVTALARARSRR